MNEREKFEAWLDSPVGNNDLCVVDTLNSHPSSDCWAAWQACTAHHEKELAALQAKVKELEEALRYHEQQTRPIHSTTQALSTTTPDQALQRALLDVLLDEYEAQGGDPRREKELRAKRAELGE